MANYPSIPWKDFLYRDPDRLGRMACGGAVALTLQIVSIGLYLTLIVRERARGWSPSDPTPLQPASMTFVPPDPPISLAPYLPASYPEKGEPCSQEQGFLLHPLSAL